MWFGRCGKPVYIETPANKTYNGFNFELFFLFVTLCKELHGNQVSNLLLTKSEIKVVMSLKWQRWSVFCEIYRTLCCSGHGFAIAERSLAVINIDLWAVKTFPGTSRSHSSV